MEINYLEGLLPDQGRLFPPPEWEYWQSNKVLSFEELVAHQQGNTNPIKISGPYLELRLPWLREMSRYTKNAENKAHPSVTFLNDDSDYYDSQEINRSRLWWAWHLMYTILSNQPQDVPFDEAIFGGWVDSYREAFCASDAVAELPENIRIAYQVIWGTLGLSGAPKKHQADNLTDSFLTWLSQGFQTTQWNGIEGEAINHTLVVDAAWEFVTTLLSDVPQDQRRGFGLPSEVFKTFYNLPTIKAAKTEVKRIPLDVMLTDKLPKTGVIHFGDREAVLD
jgi:hypothetical protein